MGLKSLVLITLVAGFMLVSAESESLEDLLRRVLSQMEKTKADADAFLQTQKDNAVLAGYIVTKGVIIGTPDAEAVSSTDTEFALKLTGEEMRSILDSFVVDNFDSFIRHGVSAEGVIYRMLAEPADRARVASATAEGKILHMSKVDLGVSVILMVKMK